MKQLLCVSLTTSNDAIFNSGNGIISLTEALDLTTATRRAMAGLLSIFAEFEREILRERVKAGIAYARSKVKFHGRPATAKNRVIKYCLCSIQA